MKWYLWVLVGVVAAHAVNMALAFLLGQVYNQKDEAQLYVMLSGGVITSLVKMLVDLVAEIF